MFARRREQQRKQRAASPEVELPPLADVHPDDLADVLDVAFWASLEQEEGRDVRAVLQLGNTPDLDGLLRFEPPRDLTPEAVRKLAPAAAVHLFALAVCRDSEHSLRIHGLQPLSSGTTGDEGPPRVEITGRGTLAVFDGQALLGTYWRGEWHVSDDGVGPHTLLVDIPARLGWAGASGYRKARCVLHMLKVMLRLGHGGTLALAPPGETWKERLDSQGMTLASERNELPRALSFYEEALRAGEQDRRWKDAAGPLWSLVEAPTERVAHLSQVDGALVLDHDLNILAFGSIIRSDSADLRVGEREWPRGSSKETPIKELGATRHQSAAWFTRDHIRAVVFVVSQDRRVSMFLGRAAGLEVYRALERYLLPQSVGPDASAFWMRQPDAQLDTAS